MREGGCIEGRGGGGVTGRILIFRLCETESELCFFSKNLSMLVYVKP